MTSLYSVLMGQPVVRQDYESRVRLAFRPRDGHFAIWDSAVEKNLSSSTTSRFSGPTSADCRDLLRSLRAGARHAGP